MTTLTQNSVITLHDLSKHSDGETLTVGRIDNNEFIELPVMAGLVLDKFDGKKSIADIGALLKFAGQDVDVADFAVSLIDLHFVHKLDGEIINERRVAQKSRYLPLAEFISRIVFSRPAIAFYVIATLFCFYTLIVDFSLIAPLLTTSGESVVTAMLVGIFMTMAALIIHESFHGLAMLREGLPVSFKLSTRLFWLVVEADMNTLYSLPRARRYLPILAGLCADFSGLFVALLLLKFELVGKTATTILSVFAVVQITAIASQLFLNIRTDLYYALANTLKSTHLDAGAKLLLKCTLGQLKARDEFAALTEKEQVLARIYSGIFITSLTLSLAIFLFYQAPFLASVLAAAAHHLGQMKFQTMNFWASLSFLGVFAVTTSLWLVMTLRGLLSAPIIKRA